MSLPQSGCYPWFINASPTLETLTATINFVANQTEYTSFNVSSDGISFNDASVYTSSWTSEENRIVIFSTLPTGELLSWLTENGLEFKLSGEAWWLNSNPTTTTSSINQLLYEAPYDNVIKRCNVFRAYSSYVKYSRGFIAQSTVDYPISGYNKFIVLSEPATDDLLTFLQTNATKIATGTTRQFTVSFDANGHGENPESKTVYYGEPLDDFPDPPTATGYRVIGWYKDDECTQKWSLYDDGVMENTTLYAKWSTTITLNGTSWYLNTVLDFTPITFASWFPLWYIGANFKTPLHTFDLSSIEESCVIMAVYDSDTDEYAWAYEDDSGEETYQEGYASSTGWMDDNSRSIEFIDVEEGSENFYIVGDLIDFLETNSPSAYTVSFNMNGHGTQVASQTVEDGSTATRPADPEADGYIFQGWFDSALTTAFDFTSPITQNTIIHAKWYMIPVLNWNGNRHNEGYTFKRVEWPNFQEHESYDYVTKGSVEYSTEADLKVTGSFDFEGYDVPDPNDLVRVYYSFTDDSGLAAYEPIATLFVNYASLNYEDTLKGIKASGSLEGSSVLKVLQDKIAALPYTVKMNTNAVYEADDIIRDAGLQTNLEASGFVLTVDKTFDSGTTYLEIVNWLLTTAGYAEAYPDGNGTVQLISTATIQSRAVKQTFKNNEQSIMYPEVEEANDWQETPNVVRLLYNTDDACIAAEAVNVTGSRASLDARGNREKTYFEEISDVGDGTKVTLLKELAEKTLKEQSCDVEYVTLSHAFVPIEILDLISIEYSDMKWSGLADNISIELEPSTKTQTKIKRTLYEDIVITSSATVYRST